MIHPFYSFLMLERSWDRNNHQKKRSQKTRLWTSGGFGVSVVLPVVVFAMVFLIPIMALPFTPSVYSQSSPANYPTPTSILANASADKAEISGESAAESALNHSVSTEPTPENDFPASPTDETAPSATVETESTAGTTSPEVATSPAKKTSSDPFGSLETLMGGPSEWLGSDGILSSAKIAVLMTILSIVPAILIMTTCYVRIITVLSILRQGLGTGQIPSTQILAAVSFFLTILVMMPTWRQVYDKAILPYSRQEISAETAFDRGQLPIRTFLWKQIEKTQNSETIWLFMRYIPDAEKPEFYEDIPWRALLPAYMVSELKTAFLIGFQLFLPFLIIDLVVSGVMVSMGMMMIPPTIVSLPFKLMLFVLMDGWTLVVKMLLDSFMMTG